MERLNKITLIIVNYGNAPNSLFFPLKIENWYSHLPLCTAGQLAVCREGVLPIIKIISSSAGGQWSVHYVWKKLLRTCYFLLNVLIMKVLIFHFSFGFYSAWRCRHIMKHFIQFCKLSCILRLFFVTFTITEIFLRISNLQHVSPKL